MEEPYFDSVVVDDKNKVVFDKDYLANFSDTLDQKSADQQVESYCFNGRRCLVLRTARDFELRSEVRVL